MLPTGVKSVAAQEYKEVLHLLSVSIVVPAFINNMTGIDERDVKNRSSKSPREINAKSSDESRS